MNSARAAKFRQLSDNILRDFSISEIRLSERMFYQKITDIYAYTSAELSFWFP